MVLFSLDATLNAAFALFAVLFFPPAALLDAAHDRGSAQPGLSPVVSLPLPPGFPSDHVPRFLPEGIVDGRYDDCCD